MVFVSTQLALLYLRKLTDEQQFFNQSLRINLLKNNHELRRKKPEGAIGKKKKKKSVSETPKKYRSTTQFHGTGKKIASISFTHPIAIMIKRAQ